VAFHLGMAMLIFASALIVAIAARRAQARLRADLTGRDRLLLGSALVAFFVMLTTGAIVVGSNASLACTGWPLCSGGLLPPPGASPLAAIHLLHRYTVAAVTILAAVVIGWVLRRGAVHGVSKAWGIVLGVLFAAQIAVGAVQVWLLMPAFWRGLHLATASAIWSVIVIIAVQASLIAAAAQPVMAAGTTLNAQPISGD
jgi:heme A synthase